jgi:hypothetical protein
MYDFFPRVRRRPSILLAIGRFCRMMISQRIIRLLIGYASQTISKTVM